MTPDTVDTGRREQAKAERRLRIVRAARDLIRETGDTNLSMRMIAKRAEVSIATPYNLFGSKRAVVLAVLEDERDFVNKLQGLKVSNSLDRIFEAHALATSYFTKDPDFYRPLCRALLIAGEDDDTGLATPERLEQTRAGWRLLLQDAQDEGMLRTDVSTEQLERTLSHFANGIMLSWAMGTLETGSLLPTAGMGYALVLAGAATPAGHKRVEARIEGFQAMLKNQPVND